MMSTFTTSSPPLRISNVSNESDSVTEMRPDEWEREYEVVRLHLKPIPLAYVCFVLVFVWFEVYWRFIRAGLFWAASVGTGLALVGTLAALYGWRKTRRFAALAALLLTAGILAAIVLPLAVGALVYFA